MNKTFLPEPPKDTFSSAMQSCERTPVKDYITLKDKHRAIVPLCSLNENHVLSPTWVCQKGLVASSSALFIFCVLCTLCHDVCDTARSSVTKSFFSHLGVNRVCVSLCGCLLLNHMLATQKTEAATARWPLKRLGAVGGLQTYRARAQSRVCKQPLCTCFPNGNATLADVTIQVIKAVAWLPNHSSMPAQRQLYCGKLTPTKLQKSLLTY